MPISAPQYDPNARAHQQAQIKYGAAEAQLNRAMESARMMEAAQRAALDQYGAAGRGVIGETYGQLHGNLEANRADTANQLGTQVDLVGQGYRDAAALGDQARADSAGRLAQLAGSLRLGGEAQADVNTGIEQLAARQLAASAQDDATRSGNLQTWSAQQDAFLRQGMAQAQREEAGAKSSFENELVRALAEMQAAAREQEYGLQGSLLDLFNEKGSFTVEQANALVDQLFGQQLQAANYNLSEQEAISAAAARAAQQALQARQMELSEREFSQNSQGNALRDFLAMSEEQRAQKGFDLDYALKQRQLSQMPEARTIDEWASQQGVDPNTINSLVQQYTNTVHRLNQGQALRESLAGLSPSEQQKAMKNWTREDRINAEQYIYNDPISQLVNDFSRGFNAPGNTNPRNALTATQLRQALGFLTPRS